MVNMLALSGFYEERRARALLRENLREIKETVPIFDQIVYVDTHHPSIGSVVYCQSIFDVLYPAYIYVEREDVEHMVHTFNGSSSGFKVEFLW